MRVSVDEMVACLEEFCQTQETGLFLIFVADKVATLALSSGQLSHCLFDGKTGMTAVHALQRLLAAHSAKNDSGLNIRFRAGQVAAAEEQLADTPTLLQLLNTNVDTPPPEQSPSAGTRPPERRIAIILTPEIKQAIRTVANMYISDGADSLCNTLFNRVKTLRPIFLLLAKEIDDADIAQAFVETLREHLQPLLDY